MSIRYGRLLPILTIAAVLLSVSATVSLAGLTLDCTPTEATSNSVWNWHAVWTDDDGKMPTLDPNTGSEGRGAGGGTTDYGLLTDGTWVDYTIGTIRPEIAEDAVSADLMAPPDGFIAFDEHGDVLPGEVYQPVGYSSIQPDPSSTLTENVGTALYDHGLDYIADYGVTRVFDYIHPTTHNVGVAVPPVLFTAPADLVGGVPPERVIGTPNPNYVITLEREPDMSAPVSVWLDAAHTQPVSAEIGAADDYNEYWAQSYNVLATTSATGIPAGTTHLYAAYSCDIEVPVPTNRISQPGAINPTTGLAPFGILASMPVLVLERAPDAVVGVWLDSAHTRPLAYELVAANTLNPAWPTYNVIRITEAGGIPAGTTRLYLSFSYTNADIRIPASLITAPGEPNADTGAIPYGVISKYSGAPLVACPSAIIPNGATVYAWADREHNMPIEVELKRANQANAAWTQTYNVVEITDGELPAGTARIYLAWEYGTPGIQIPGVLATEPGNPDPTTGIIPERIIRGDAVSKINACIAVSRMPIALVGVWSDANHTQPIDAKISIASAINSAWTQNYNVIEITDEDGLPVSGKIYIQYYCPGTHYVFTQKPMLTPPYTVYSVPMIHNTDPFLVINDSITRLVDNAPAGILGIYTTPELDASDVDPTNYHDLAAFDPAVVPLPYEVLPSGFGKAYFSSGLPTGITTANDPATLYVKVSTNAVDGVWTVRDHTEDDTNHYTRSDGSVIGYCARSGIIRLPRPLPEPEIDPALNTQAIGAQCYVTYRYMTGTDFTIGRTPNLGYVAGLTDLLRPLDPDADTWELDAADVTIVPNTGKFSIKPDGAPPYGTYAATIDYNVVTPDPITGQPMPTVWLNGNIPMNYIRGNARTGAEFRVSVSAGLNMSNRKQQPAADRSLNTPLLNPTLIFDNYGYPMYYCSALAYNINPVKLTARGQTRKDSGELVTYVSPETVVNVRGSSSVASPVIRYGGGGSEDWLTVYSDASGFPASQDVDPLSVEPLNEMVPATPDDGSSSTMFVFRVRYHNNRGLPPLPWLPSMADQWGGAATGVVLYLDAQGTGNYQPHFMQPDWEQPGLGSSVWMYRVIPHHRWKPGAPGPWAYQSLGMGPYGDDLYTSLAMGTYHYFFACSDDSLTFDDGSLVLSYQANPVDWAGTYSAPYYSTPLDPSDARAVPGYPEIDRPANRRYTSNGINRLDSALYVDRPTRIPGLFEGNPPFKYSQLASEHPLVTCELHMPNIDDWGNKGYDDSSYGYGRFFGTLFPFRLAVNPAHPGAYDLNRGDNALMAETSGSYSSDTNTFIILYKQYQNKAPISVKLWINDASEKSGTTAAHQYRSYTMVRRADQVNPNYVQGVWYECALQSGSTDLPAGPHTYYFTANDGYHIARWPVRPDHYHVDDGVSIGRPWDAIDYWVPTQSYAWERNNADYFDNDYVPGPFINSRPTITNVSVTPGLGKEGTHFVYRCTFKDGDGQRINDAKITIQMDDAGTTREFKMVPDPKYYSDPNVGYMNPSFNNSALYKSGVDLVLDTATIQDFTLAKGVRKFFITVTDDWGFQYDVNDLRTGELVRYPEGNGNWVQGPVVSGNTAPTLYNGHVDSMDSTANSATVWSFKVTYRDIDRDAPAWIKVFIGREQPADPTATSASSVKTVIWDSGHTMLPSDPGDTVYSHGVEYYFQTRLAGPEDNLVGTEGSPVQYYYAFETYDGVDYATYKNSSQVDQRSDAAGCFIRQDAQALDTNPGDPRLNFKITPKIARPLALSAAANAIDPDPNRINDIVRVLGVYTNEDLSGTNYYSAGSATSPPYDNVAHPLIPLDATIPAGMVWVRMETTAPIVGPLPMTMPAPAGIIPDAQVYKDFAQSGTPLLITDQQNGHISEDGTDRAVVMMNGSAIFQGRPSSEYILPDSATDIASVEGVYWRADSSQPWFNYYNKDVPPPAPTDPNTSLVPPVYRVGRLVATTYQGLPVQTVQFDDPEEIDKVFGVYDNPELTGVNHYYGAGYPGGALWQQAFILKADATHTNNVIWPTKPNDIASIAGVYVTMNQMDPQGNFLTPDDPVADPIPYVVPGTVNPDGSVSIEVAHNIGGAVKRILQVNELATMQGEDYYVAVDPSGDPYDSAVPIVPNTGVTPATETVWVSYVPAINFGDEREFIALKTPLPLSMNTVCYIAYYPAGKLTTLTGQGEPDSLRRVVLHVPFASVDDPVYVKIWPKAFNPGLSRDDASGTNPFDGYIKLTTKLPDFTTPGTVTPSAPGVVELDADVVAEIGAVTGVFMEGDGTGTNYYLKTSNPYVVGDLVVRLGTAINTVTGTITVNYLPKNRNVLVKYHDMRFTHRFTGNAARISNVAASWVDGSVSASMTQGNTHLRLTGVNTNITGNDPVDVGGTPVPRDICGGIVGAWITPDLGGINYFNPRRTSLYPDNPPWVRLSTEVPDGTGLMYVQAYQKGVYFIDRWNRQLRFDETYAADPTSGINDLSRIQVSYFFGTKMSQVLVKNSLPELYTGMVTPISGSRNSQYVYSVWYRDVDGPTGQIPAYVRVYIDKVPHDMTPVNQGTPDYKAGAKFVFTPTGGLTGEKHSYYFEASDGSAIAWFDNNGAHKSEVGSTPENIVDIEGPWVNDPPTLLNGLVSPNPTPPAGIGTTDSVDYRVTLMDPDNDQPYVYDPLRDLTGKDYSGSPRAWIDAGLSDDTAAPRLAYVVGLEADPLEVTKQRVIVAKIDDGAGHLVDPNWSTDQFAGKLLQISNGNTWNDVSPSPYLTVYLIQSNTSNKLVIAADTLQNDKLLVPNDPQTGQPRYVQFRINGLLMTKVNPAQQNFALGVEYKVNVPRLAVGNHKFHFTARTRENKPAWLLAIPGTNQDPFSVMVRFPTLGDSIGPNVVSTPSPDNVAPVLTKMAASPSSTLYRGPQAQYATVVTSGSVMPSNHNRLLMVQGVYRNANFDAHLSTDPALPPAQQQKNFYVSASTTPPAAGQPVLLTTNLYPCPDTTLLVQRTKSVDSPSVIEPDMPAAIDSVVGVYTTTDPTLQNVYTVASPTLDANNKINLSMPLPASATDAYIVYRPKKTTAAVTADGTVNVPLPSPNSIAYVMGVYLASDTGFVTNLIDPAAWTPGNATIALTGGAQPIGTQLAVRYVAWPPAYIKLFAVEPAGSPSGTPLKHGIFVAGEPLTFEIFYQDANGDRPTYHDGVQGYVKLVFNDISRTAQLLPLIPPSDYKVGVPFGVTLTDVPEGLHSYHFEASDGYVVTRFPADQPGTGANDEKVQINNKPVLSNGQVDHNSGAGTFLFSVTYADHDNVFAAGSYVRVVVTRRGDPATTTTVNMTAQSPVNYFAGTVFVGSVDLSGMPDGTYDTVFQAHDATQAADNLVGPSINKRTVDPGYHPLIAMDGSFSGYLVYKALAGGGLGAAAGKTSDTFVYRARYKDEYNDPPVATFSGVRQTALTLTIDPGTSHSFTVPMPMVPMLGTPDYTGVNYDQWPWFEARVSGKRLGGGNHTYTVSGSNGTVATIMETGVPATKSGPVLMIPYFDLSLTAKDGSTVTDQAIVGQEVLIGGQMLFPYVADQQPNAINNIIIQVTKPDGTIVSMNASLSTTSVLTDGLGNPINWVGEIQVNYSGYVDPALITGQSLTLVASGQWAIDAIWPGDSQYDGAQTDSTFDAHNDQIRVTVSGPSRTVAVAEPMFPESSAPVTDMVTPPMMIGSTSPGGIFGYDRALTMNIAKWVPSSGRYYRYDVGGYFPNLAPGDAVWVKPKLGSGTPGTGYPAAESLFDSSVKDGWTALDNPTVQGQLVGGTPRYLLSKYRLIKVLAQAYPLQLATGGAAVLDPVTKLPLLRSNTISLNAGWNQIGNIFFNWQKTWQSGVVPSGPPPPPGDCEDFGTVQPSDPNHISRVLGVYTTATPSASDTNYYQPGVACQPYVRGDSRIHLTQALPEGVTNVFIKYEAYPKVDVGIPISEVKVKYLGQTKTLAEAKTNGWVADYAWRWDAITKQYVPVSSVAAEKVLKAWSGYWLRAFVNCQIEIDPNTSYNGVAGALSAKSAKSRSVTAVAPTAVEDMEAPPPAPQD